ncbi:hypothetical protein BN8_01954 [Fibrisoma limi BUZ 3]|uniref:Bacterial bifunctional deaminase-reductase C-terminal domain-containing protein n=1 Tax=Fibrisoma limi BUZ 3 TaxID=1185876 RepID=I2GG88_9BACT|nr:dihydrofolate reductase family protein [Fibrisoma limi]CCH52913.1 hypothetical protein BN8_01954 [Fibrisoma limi BUZ 3]
MKTIKLLIATSLDGYIAGPDGDISWLTPFEEVDYGYTDFIATIDTTLMGNTTYQHVLTFGDFPYKDKTNYVFTRQATTPEPGAPYVQFVSTDVAEFVSRLKQQNGLGIWLVGGSQLNAALLEASLIDEILLFLIPVTIGRGIPLFAPSANQQNWQLTGCQSLDKGMVQLNYRRS